MSKEKIIIIFTVLIDVIGLGVIIPIMPIYVESFGVSVFTVTLLFSVFSFCFFLSAPILGVLSDKYGRRPILMLSILSTSIGWMIFASAQSIFFIFLGRIIDGLAAGNFSTAQSAISDLAKNKKDRTANLGIIGAIFGVGFLVGPFLGGILSRISHNFPFWFVAGLSFFNFILAYFFLPETNKNLDKNKKIVWNPLKPILSAIKNIKLRKLYVVWFLFNSVAVGSNSIFALYLLKKFNFGAYKTGLFFTVFGVIIAFNQGVALKRFWLKKFDEKQLIVLMFSVFTVAFLLMAYPTFWFFVTGVMFVALAQSILRVSITSEVVGYSQEKEQGQAMGVLSAIMSSASIIAPICAGILFQFQIFLPYLAGSFISLVALFVIFQKKHLKNI